MEQAKSLVKSRTIHIHAAVLLLLLAIFDAFFTDYGIRHHYIEEANPLMRFLYDTSIVSFFLVKTILPLLLLYFVSKFKIKPYFVLLLLTTLLLYLTVFCMHVLWISKVSTIIN